MASASINHSQHLYCIWRRKFVLLWAVAGKAWQEGAGDGRLLDYATQATFWAYCSDIDIRTKEV